MIKYYYMQSTQKNSIQILLWSFVCTTSIWEKTADILFHLESQHAHKPAFPENGGERS